MISFCQFGAGRIGAIHAANIAAYPQAQLHTIVDTDRVAAEDENRWLDGTVPSCAIRRKRSPTRPSMRS